MKKVLGLVLCLSFTLSSCFMDRQFAGTMIGAHVGGVLGSAIFGEHSYTGAVFGDVVGTIAGAAIGSAITAPKDRDREDLEEAGSYSRPNDVEYNATSSQRRPSYKLDPVRNETSKAMAELKVKNLRFVDQNRNRIINANETCQLIFDIYNDGKSTVNDITPYIYEVNKSKHIYISDPSVIRSLRPGESVNYVIHIKTDSSLRKGKATFCIELVNPDGLTVPCREFDLQTDY